MQNPSIFSTTGGNMLDLSVALVAIFLLFYFMGDE